MIKKHIDLMAPFGFIYDAKDILGACEKTKEQIKFFEESIKQNGTTPTLYYKILGNIIVSKCSLTWHLKAFPDHVNKFINHELNIAGEGSAGIKYALNNLLKMIQPLEKTDKTQTTEWEEQKTALFNKINYKSLFTTIKEVEKCWNNMSELNLSVHQAEGIKNSINEIKELIKNVNILKVKLHFLNNILEQIEKTPVEVPTEGTDFPLSLFLNEDGKQELEVKLLEIENNINNDNL